MVVIIEHRGASGCPPRSHRNEFRQSIPRRVGLHQSPPPLPLPKPFCRMPSHSPSDFQRMVDVDLTSCLTKGRSPEPRGRSSQILDHASIALRDGYTPKRSKVSPQLIMGQNLLARSLLSFLRGVWIKPHFARHGIESIPVRQCNETRKIRPSRCHVVCVFAPKPLYVTIVLIASYPPA